MFCVKEFGHVCCRLLAVLPGNSVRRRTMQTGVRRKQSIGDPAVINFGRRISLYKRRVTDDPENTRAVWSTSKPPMSCEANAKPDSVRLNAPRSASAMASNVDSQSPPQCYLQDALNFQLEVEKDGMTAYHGEPLTAYGGRPGEHDSFSDAEALL